MVSRSVLGGNELLYSLTEKFCLSLYGGCSTGNVAPSLK